MNVTINHEFIDLSGCDKAFIFVKADKQNDDKTMDINYAPVIAIIDTPERINPVPIERMIDGVLYKRFDDLTFKIGKAVRFSEIINNDLNKCIKTYSEKFDLANLTNRNSKCRELKKYDFNKNLTFMQLKQVLSCILKTETSLHKIERLDSSEKRKKFTTHLTSFILNRDYLVHGNLHFLHPEFVPVLKIVENNNQKFLKITNELLQNTLFVFNYLVQILGEINYKLQNDS